MNIKFSPPDIGEDEITAVAETLRSGWITTGPKSKLFENKISKFCGTEKTVCLNSATAGLELTLKILGVGDGDEVITSAYTYTASASVIQHVGAKIVLCDTQKDSYAIDYDKLENLITSKTKVIIPVDIAGVMCDYDKIFSIVETQKSRFKPSSKLQELFGRIIVLADAAHSFGATYKGLTSGSVADFSSFSFHAVKNLTTGEGGAVTWKSKNGLDNEWLYHQFMLWSLHGQSK
ncbi:MAG: DegT/DnrJ/EryC1/StrS aminotransferase family protein, partial [Clostridia bacterium]